MCAAMGFSLYIRGQKRGDSSRFAVARFHRVFSLNEQEKGPLPVPLDYLVMPRIDFVARPGCPWNGSVSRE